LHSEAVPSQNKLVVWGLQQYLKRRPLIVCRTAQLTRHKGLFLPDDPAQRMGVMHELRGVMRDMTRQHNGSFFLADYLDERDLGADWGDFFPLPEFGKSSTQLIVEWATWDEFMQALRVRSKKQHKNVRHNTRYAQDMGLTITFHEPHNPPPVEAVVPLIMSYGAKYHAGFTVPDITQTIQALARLAAENYVWITAELDGKIVACEVLLFDEQTRVSRPILYGRDYDVPYVYFYLAYEDIRYAIEELHARIMIYDTDAYDFKQRIGFVDDPRHHLVFDPGSRLERGLAALLMRFMND
ncbi:MAG: N-acetyltransferase, partial [Anaerolineae bacterium]|nr:N-acetyltransferase [Anaerolineae bacterium]